MTAPDTSPPCVPPSLAELRSADAEVSERAWGEAYPLLWKATVGGVVASGPMTYAVGGRQYVAVAAGSSLFTFALRQ